MVRLFDSWGVFKRQLPFEGPQNKSECIDHWLGSVAITEGSLLYYRVLKKYYCICMPLLLEFVQTLQSQLTLLLLQLPLLDFLT